ncbi:MAG TPA: hypothetical protein IAA78_07645 [Candidatus Avamphibacillus intestinigallinarum]|nr:hypothetical protein [Candidatus Avamphibacillus intestinigallinarum]
MGHHQLRKFELICYLVLMGCVIILLMKPFRFIMYLAFLALIVSLVCEFMSSLQFGLTEAAQKQAIRLICFIGLLLIILFSS